MKNRIHTDHRIKKKSSPDGVGESFMIKSWFLGRLPEWFVQWVVLPVAWLTFFGGVWLAAHRFPGEYDWRYMTISLLLSVHENPHGHWIIAPGISPFRTDPDSIARFLVRASAWHFIMGSEVGLGFYGFRAGSHDPDGDYPEASVLLPQST